MATIWSNKNGAAIRGTIRVASSGDTWPYGSRQVRKAAMRELYFNEFSRLNIPRRIRRLMARKKCNRVYAETAASMLENGVVLERPAMKKGRFHRMLGFKFARKIQSLFAHKETA